MTPVENVVTEDKESSGANTKVTYIQTVQYLKFELRIDPFIIEWIALVMTISPGSSSYLPGITYYGIDHKEQGEKLLKLVFCTQIFLDEPPCVRVFQRRNMGQIILPGS